jgi:hypothetical protein
MRLATGRLKTKNGFFSKVHKAFGTFEKMARESHGRATVAQHLNGSSATSAAVQRWAAVGPYYAMMPTSFALQQIKRFTVPGDVVLDPFCGRGTVPFAAAALGRSFFGIEIFPVGWVYSVAKCKPATQKRIIERLEQLARLRPSSIERSEFFRAAYSTRTLRFLCTARQYLDWRRNQTDRTLMALILISLHDKKGVGLSNQMRQTKAFHPDYAVRWWKRNHKSTPPDVDPFEVMKAKIKWRYAKGIPTLSSIGKIYLGDCTRILPSASRIGNVKLLFTSPPYFQVTNYYIDQWLRNWMLGGPPRPCSGQHTYMKRFDSKENYRVLLERTFTTASRTLRDDAVICVRTDARQFALQTTKDVLHEIFPTKRMMIKISPLNGRLSQTALFGDKQQKPGEVDLFLQ